MDAADFVDETAPLLPAIENAPHKPTPLPKAQLAILCTIRLMDPLTFTQIFPYINQFLTSLNLVPDKSHIGFYSGLVESSFALFQLLFIYHWARISDMAGRRPVIIIGTAGLSISTILLGLASSLPQILIARCLAGTFSGIAAVLHSVLGELTDQSNQTLAFPIYGLFWPLGSIVGPLIGGTLANPADQYPRLFGSFDFLIRYPYFLPCFFSGFLALCTTLITYSFLREQVTHLGQQKTALLDVRVPNKSAAEMSTRDLFSIPIIGALCLSGCALCFIATAFDAVFVLFCYTPVESGGLSFDTSQIGYALAIAGASSIIIQLTLLPSLLRTFSHARLYNFFMFLWPFTFAALPILRFTLISGGSHPGPHRLGLVWVEIVILMSLSRFGCLAYSVSLILCKDHAPAPRALAKTNGLVLVGMCIARAIAPAFVSSVFAWSIQHHFMGGYFWILVMVLICLVGCSLSKRIALPQAALGPL
ncbi:MFS general substrate transporter [Macrolepiota fuliginosa MF-IS2]|uniref:MFS general substrate transporter n=1 Tax=Macrolepiota fuliginosa MF-IS2 TaxID=1400762 RepID=A0A9P5XP57_9AGAR|nr:MFS general substrate transporter [Macrolepiota fuliginosa MF-IS2]